MTIESIALVLASTAAAMATGGVAYAVRRERRRRLEALKTAATSSGLTDIVTSNAWFGEVRVTARAEKLSVRLTELGAGGHAPETRIAIELAGARSRAFTLQTEDMAWRANKAYEVEVGDAPFDSTFFVGGGDPRMLAVLDAPTRALLLSLHGHADVCIHSNILTASLRDTARQNLPDVLAAMIRLAGGLERTAIAPQLARNAAHDPSPDVRLTNLLTLTRDFAEHDDTMRAVHTALADESPAVRLHAALSLGDKGRPVLFDLAETLADDAAAAQAIAALGKRLRRDEIDAILERALPGGYVQTARACVEYLGGVGDAAATDRLVSVLAQATGDLALATVVALGQTNAAAEPALLDALQRGTRDVRVAAAEALGRVGTVAAVRHLGEAEDYMLDRVLARAAREAIAQIHGRVDGASPGQLSLAELEAGRLSIAPREAGQVSLPRGDRGELSWPPKGEED